MSVQTSVCSSVGEVTAASAVSTELPVGQISVVAMDDAQNKPQDLEQKNKGVITMRALRTLGAGEVQWADLVAPQKRQDV